MLLLRRIPWLTIAAAASAVVLVALVAATFTCRGRVRIARLHYGDGSVAVGARDGSVALQLRRTHTPGPESFNRTHVNAYTVGYASPLVSLCITDHGDRWLLPGLWLGAGRDTYVHYLDILLPPWLTLPATLLLPAAWYRRHRRRRHSRGFAVVSAPTDPGAAPTPR